MATEDYWNKPRPVGYFDTLLVTNPLKLIRKYSVCPPDNLVGDIGQLAHTYNSVRDDNTDIAHRSMVNRVAYVELTKQSRGQVFNTGNEGGDVIKLTGDYTPDVTKVPVYWLPWDTSGAVIEITIPAMAHGGDGTPDLFFTAAINGCSIFFQGTQQNPTIYHCGGDTCKGSDYAAGALFWRNLMANNVLGGVAPVLPLATNEVNKTHYVKEVGHPGTTAAAQNYELWLQTNSSNRLNIEEVFPWGCVMGVRDTTTGDWTFYLQENATVVYKVLKKKPFLGKQKPVTEKTNVGVKVDQTRFVARPLIFREIFPNRPGGGIYISKPAPRLSHG